MHSHNALNGTAVGCWKHLESPTASWSAAVQDSGVTAGVADFTHFKDNNFEQVQFFKVEILDSGLQEF